MALAAVHLNADCAAKSSRRGAKFLAPALSSVQDRPLA
jgi:hypothetical protein